MANTKRRIIDRSGNMFLPMNMEGNNYTDSFWQTPKLIVGGQMMFILLAILLSPVVGEYPIQQMLKLLLLWAVVMFFVLRYVIFEERFNYKMYKQMQEYEISTPATFWDIVQIKNTSDGAILTYRDGKTAVMLKVDRDTITGKPRDFKETHFDAIQDFYNRLQNYRFSFVQMNVMEPAGNDPRLAELDKLVTKSDNPNIQKLIQLEVGYTKSITKRTLYESDIFLIYVKDRTRVDTIINDVEECVFELLNGAYIGYRIMNEDEILDFIKDQYGVSYFNRTQATLSLFSRMNSTLKPTFSVQKVEDTYGREYDISKRQFNTIHNMAVAYEKGKYDINKLDIKNDVISKDPKYADLVKFDDLQLDVETLNQGVSNVQNNRPVKNKAAFDDEQQFKLKKDLPKKPKDNRSSQNVLGRNMTNQPDGRLLHSENQGSQQNIVNNQRNDEKKNQGSLLNKINKNRQNTSNRNSSIQSSNLVEIVDDDAVEVDDTLDFGGDAQFDDFDNSVNNTEVNGQNNNQSVDWDDTLDFDDEELNF